jgi:hypothetical protein
MNEPTGDWAQTVVHLLALAERLEGHGQLNLAKLTRASADSLVRRAGYSLNLPHKPEDAASDLGHVFAALPGYGLPDALAEAMARGRDVMVAGELPLYDMAPDPYVCRTCGELTMQEPVDPCVVCGAWPTTFRRFRPIYWMDELNPPEALAQLRSTPRQVASFMNELDEAQLSRPATDGGWSIRQIVSHLRYAEGVLNFRVELMAREDNPSLESQAVFNWSDNESENPEVTAEMFRTYQESRSRTLAILDGLSAWAWLRKGYHTEFGPVTILQQASYFSTHEQTHLASLLALRNSLTKAV